MKKRVLLSAIAKDEAAYLPEWVAYHLNLGVDHIRVFVNNIDDNTREVLQKIAEVAPVSIFNADVYWQDKDLPIDKATKSTFLTKNRFQARSMSRMYRMATLEGYDYLLSIDVDEFLYLDGSSLPDFLETAKIEKAARFQWFNVSGDETEFVAPVAPEINGDWAPLHKLLIKTGLGDRIFESPHDLANFNNSACEGY